MSNQGTPTSSGVLHQLTSSVVRAGVRSLIAVTLLTGVAAGAFALGGRPVFAPLLAGACVIGASALGLLIVRQSRGKPARQIPILVLGASGARMMIGLCLALLVYMAASPEGRDFWGAFLGIALAGLVLETMWVIRAMNSYNASAVAGDHGSNLTGVAAS